MSIVYSFRYVINCSQNQSKYILLPQGDREGDYLFNNDVKCFQIPETSSCNFTFIDNQISPTVL